MKRGNILKLNGQLTQELDIGFQNTADGLVKLLNKEGFKIKAFREGSPPLFVNLQLEQKAKIVKGLSTFYEICNSAIEKEIALTDDSHSLLWWALKELKLRPLSDIFEYLTSSDAVEIYTTDHIQVFRSFNMFHCLSYSIDELSSCEWWQLYHRDQQHTDQFISMLTQIVSGQTRNTIFLDGPKHWVEEVFSEFKRKSLISTRLFSPLFQGKTIAGYLSATRIYETYDISGERVF